MTVNRLKIMRNGLDQLSIIDFGEHVCPQCSQPLLVSISVDDVRGLAQALLNTLEAGYEEVVYTPSQTEEDK